MHARALLTSTPEGATDYLYAACGIPATRSRARPGRWILPGRRRSRSSGCCGTSWMTTRRIESSGGGAGEQQGLSALENRPRDGIGPVNQPYTAGDPVPVEHFAHKQLADDGAACLLTWRKIASRDRDPEVLAPGERIVVPGRVDYSSGAVGVPRMENPAACLAGPGEAFRVAQVVLAALALRVREALERLAPGHARRACAARREEPPMLGDPQRRRCVSRRLVGGAAEANGAGEDGGAVVGQLGPYRSLIGRGPGGSSRGLGGGGIARAQRASSGNRHRRCRDRSSAIKPGSSAVPATIPRPYSR